ncbi:hypothetical protein [Microbacterium sp. NPDC055455]
MATITAQASGNWSNTATWVGGVKPGVGDTASSGNFTVTIDEDISVQTLQIPTGAVGKFAVSSVRNITLSTGLSVGAHTSAAVAVLDFLAGSGGSVLTVTGGDIIGDTTAAGSEPFAVQIATAVTIVGSALGSAGNAINVASGGVLTLVTATGGSNGYGVSVASGGVAFVTNAVGGGNGISGVNVASGGVATVTHVTGGTGSTACGLNVLAGGSGSIAAGGTITASSTSAAVRNESTDAVLLRAGVTATDHENGMRALGEGRFVIDDSGDFINHVRTVASTSWPTASYDSSAMLTTQESDDLPAAADVRDGVTFGPSGILTGTLAVPPAASVAAGVPVDDTVGTAAVSLADVAAVTGAQIAAATSA